MESIMDLKQWQCKNNHMLGMIRLNGNGITQLMLYRHAVDLSAEHPAEVDVLGPLVGRMPVQCDICGDVQLWDIPVETLADLIKGLKEWQLEQLGEKLMEVNTKRAKSIRSRARIE